MNWTKQLAQLWFYVQSVRGKCGSWDGEIQCTPADWKINWFRPPASEWKCYSILAKDGLRFDVYTGKSKFCPIHTYLASVTIKNGNAYLSPVHHSLVISLLYSFIYDCLCSAPRQPRGILLPACFKMPWHNLKVQSLVASKNTTERAVADWIKQINTAPIFQNLVPWANTVCFSIIPLQGLLWRKQSCVGTAFGGAMLCMFQEIWRFFFLVIRGLILKHFESWACT